MRLLRLLTLGLVLLAPLALQAQRERFPAEDLEIIEKNWPNAQKTSTSIRTLVLQEGSGEKPKSGQEVSVVYTGKLLNGTVFNEYLDKTKPFTFRLDRGQVIEGWEEGIAMMRPGEKRLLIIPYELGYGTRGQPPHIPRRASLVFEVELLAVKDHVVKQP